MDEKSRARIWDEIESLVRHAKYHADCVKDITADKPNMIQHANEASTSMAKALALREMLEELE